MTDPSRRWTGAAAPASPPPTRTPSARREPLAFAALYAFDLFVFWEWWDLPGGLSLELAAPAVALVAYVVLAVGSRRRPGAAFAVVCGIAVAASALRLYHPYLSVTTGLYLVALRRPTRISVAALAVAAGLISALEIFSRDRLGAVPAPADLAMPVLAWCLLSTLVWAVATRLRRERLKVQRLDARREADATAAVAAERVRIARDLHDIVAHSVSVIVLQAAGAQRVLASDPARAGQALAVIEQTGLESMQELRRLLGVLRSSGAGDTGRDERSDTEHQPGLDDLDDLVALACRTGLPTTLTSSGRPCHLDPSVELAAYRVVQEALTNTRKHAGAHARATVRLTWSDRDLVVDVSDERLRVRDVPPPQPDADALPLSMGHGLLGLRERVSAIGGSLAAGDGVPGFRVTARLPCSTVPPRAADRTGRVSDAS